MLVLKQDFRADFQLSLVSMKPVMSLLKASETLRYATLCYATLRYALRIRPVSAACFVERGGSRLAASI